MTTNQAQVSCRIDGYPLSVPAGRTIAAAIMLEGGQARLRDTRFAAEPRGVFCGIGVCFDCLVSVDGSAPLRSCLIEVADGMEITTSNPHKREDSQEDHYA